ncbi:uncharacterized protein Dana_GF28000 [Drosophila ananassae]|uniref:Uncharacterized protein n=1 Tax=Drosophila ananassae TaxID=7217 RepID=A0A0P8XLH8_DROAN|nr:uncharacterized protein Dana_GF28000 [Drosophila ananassae]
MTRPLVILTSPIPLTSYDIISLQMVYIFWYMYIFKMWPKLNLKLAKLIQHQQYLLVELLEYWVLGMPADVLKSRLQSAPEGTYRMGVRSVFKELILKDGPMALYRGVTPIMIRAFPANAACFFGIEKANNFFDICMEKRLAGICTVVASVIGNILPSVDVKPRFDFCSETATEMPSSSCSDNEDYDDDDGVCRVRC